MFGGRRWCSIAFEGRSCARRVGCLYALRVVEVSELETGTMRSWLSLSRMISGVDCPLLRCGGPLETEELEGIKVLFQATNSLRHSQAYPQGRNSSSVDGQFLVEH